MIAKNGNPEQLPLIVGIRVTLMVGDICVNELDGCMINGQEFICDLKDLPYKYSAQCSTSTLKAISTFLQGAYPMRLKGAHFINVPPFIYAVIKTFKSFLSKKLRDRVRYT